tara:strand:- start:202 stop:612 length:411 start_codon:yes stop_codon:yes gene_type:complete
MGKAEEAKKKVEMERRKVADKSAKKAAGQGNDSKSASELFDQAYTAKKVDGRKKSDADKGSNKTFYISHKLNNRIDATVKRLKKTLILADKDENIKRVDTIKIAMLALEKLDDIQLLQMFEEVSQLDKPSALSKIS